MLFTNQSTYQYYQRGISLLETLLYIIVIVAVAASTIGYFKASSRAQKLANAVSEATNILQVAAQYWESNQTFFVSDSEKFDESVVIASGFLPTRYTKLSYSSFGHIATPWTEISPQSVIQIQKQNSGGFDLVFTNIPESVCGALKQQLSTIGYSVVDNCNNPLSAGKDTKVTIQVRRDKKKWF